MENEAVVQTLCVAVFLGILAQYVAKLIRIPGLIVLMVFGVVAGPQFLHLLEVDKLSNITAALISVGVAVILFEGGMKLQLKDLRMAPRATLGIIGVGPLVTLGLVTVILHYVLGLRWDLAAVGGSLVTVSGPTVIEALLARGSLAKRIKDILTWEAILVEAFGGVIMVVVLHFVLSESGDTLHTLQDFFTRMLVGVGFGIVAGKLLRYLVPKRIIHHELLNLSILGVVLLAFWLANHLAHESGLMTAVIAGFIVGQLRHPDLEKIRDFKEQMSLLVISVIFVLLAARFEIQELWIHGWPMVIAVAGILFVVRPIMVFSTTVGSGLCTREKAFLSWISPRGVIAAATASLFSIILEHEGFENAKILETIVFLVILSTVVLQGLTVVPVAKLLKVMTPPRNGFLLVGIHPFSIVLGKLLKEEGIPVLLVGHEGKYEEEAKKAGLEAKILNVLDEEELEAAGMERMGTMLALTEKDETNTLVCRVGQKVIGMHRAYQIVNTFFSDVTDEVLLNLGGQPAFDMKMSVQTLNERLESGRLKIEKLNLEKCEEGYKLPDNFMSALIFIDEKKITIAQEDDKIRTPHLIALSLA